MANDNYFPKKEKELEIPEFLQNSGWSDNTMNKPIYEDEYDEDYASDVDIARKINEDVAQASHERQNHYHFKELDKQADAYSEDEAKVIIKRLVSNYPEIVLGEVADLIKDMQELSGVILQNSSIFAKKRGAV